MSVSLPDKWKGGVKPFDVRRHGPKTAELLTDFEGFGCTIPKGYITDGASTPRLFYNILARFTIGYPAAIVHDERYDPYPDEDGNRYRTLTRKQADLEFLENLKDLGVNFFRRHAAYRAVRAGGWRAWRNGRKKGIIDLSP